MMENTAVQLQRARRRYKELLRERANLALFGESDPLMEDKIEMLERTYPELVHANTECPEGESKRKASSSSPADSSSSKAKASTHNAAPISRSLSSFPAAQPSTQVCLRGSAAPSLQMHTPPFPNPLPCALSADALPRCLAHTCTSRADRHIYFMMLALRLFNEWHQKWMMTRLNVGAIALLSAAVALVHCTIFDLAFIPGSLLTPSVLTLLLHANALCGVYLQRRRRFTAPMLIVYTIFDAFPSLGLGVVSYNLSRMVLGCCDLP
ncbi:hypothetical protein ABL78_3057 [Leptomonas seymouri]|uniref:Uncharacterized protein n=1 Tax=Leptomonas seymouri TaxID=5684 RepID=A0A0N1I8C0_LEPSE|nr:hypothetical protein ABL78_3057 [Leptomonas seymouri]|eukprot:KPI87830.1 hypothetical protein ABL78_3057 [Leptomonas seymouri]